MDDDYKFYEKNNGVFTCFIKAKSENFKTNLIEFLIIVNKYYPSFLLKEIGSDEFDSWENKYLSKSITSYFTIRFKIYYMKNGFLNFGFLNDCLTVDIDDIETSKENLTSITFHMQPVVNTFKYIVVSDNGDELTIEEDQTEASKLNRKIITEFLKNVESEYGEIYEFSTACAIDQQYLYKYGILENAVQDNF